ncbi:helix-turn-helix domain-containing protein [Limosilactobacillus reuteri]|uniref:helix-turn-helix domain-containing protein n=1 Tax=Limosilactobacillus reuteri TaxID=1598 RepID=UPI002B0555B7|nr:helix-turn-helix transcriptional regulator [Limosilactobacillus reuteri]
MNLSEIFARNLRVRMATLGLKTSDLYKMTGISKTTLMALQSGRNKGVQFTTVEKLAIALKCNPWQLFDEDMNWAAYKWANTYQGGVTHE